MTLLILLTACAGAPPPAVHPPAGDAELATLYIYRPRAFVGFALRPTVTLDGQDLIRVKNGTVWFGKFKPGIYKIEMDDKTSGAEIDMKAGQSYYIRLDIGRVLTPPFGVSDPSDEVFIKGTNAKVDVPRVWKGGGRLTMVPNEQGSIEIRGLDRLPRDEVEHAAFKGM